MPWQNGRHFGDDIFGCISINISLKFVPKGQINNIAAMIQKMAWHRPGIIWTNDGKFTDTYMRHSPSMS